MEFQFFAITESFTSEKSHLIYELSSALNTSFLGKAFGKDVIKIHVTFLLVLERPGYENWYKPPKLSYIDHKLTKSKLTGEGIEINKQLAFGIRLDENTIGQFLNADEKSAKRLILDLVSDYLLQTKTWPKKVKDFDCDALLRDIRVFSDKLISPSINGD